MKDIFEQLIKTQVFSNIQNAEGEIYFVGGCVSIQLQYLKKKYCNERTNLYLWLWRKIFIKIYC